MKRLQKLIAVIAVAAFAVTATVAYADPLVIQAVRAWFKAGIFVGTTAPAVAGNKVTKMLGNSATIDFVSGTIVCTDSAAITVTGAVAGDPCFVGAPTTAAANSTFTCYVSAADAVKVRHCPAGSAIDPASATYFVRVISSQ